ncbi:protein CNGC15b-like [Rhodamnia argentea]|uniref:Protein CNGC15b-like n=1 Tax=Rhodamnia argentea TaxID=178133 RepID=A0A8B8NVL2_9MYRT|nr:protein CNGC15b-like [Rhodamnia argentea]
MFSFSLFRYLVWRSKQAKKYIIVISTVPEIIYSLQLLEASLYHEMNTNSQEKLAENTKMACGDRNTIVRVRDESVSVGLPTMKQYSTSSLNQNEGTRSRNLALLKSTSQKAGKYLKSKVLRRVFSEDYEKVKNKIRDPRGQTVQSWNRIFLTACLIGLFMDPLFFYVPSVDDNYLCFYDGFGLKILLIVIRSIADVFYIIQVIIRFNTAFIAPSSRVFGRGELVIDYRKIALRYLRSRFWIDLYVALPLPQVLIWAIIPSLGGSTTTKTKNMLLFVIFFQYVPRVFLILPLRLQISNAGGGLTKKAWEGAAFNLMLYMLASHVSGACWYLLSIERQVSCWRMACDQENPPCQYSFFDCRYAQDPGRVTWYASTNVTTLCNGGGTGSPIQFGIYFNGVTNAIGSCKFFSKYFYSLWWGLNNLSCMGQNLEFTSSTYVAELLFTIAVAILGLVLFTLLIGNMQQYLQTANNQLEQWRLKRIDTEQWMHHRHLPPELRESIQTYDEYRWVATRGVDEESLLKDFPMDLRRNIKRHLCFDLVRRVPLFNQMDERTLDAICERLKPLLCTGNMYLVREGDPVREMFFLFRGHLDSWTTNGGRTGFYNSSRLIPGDFCGEELLTWALDLRPSIVLPSSTRTVKAVKEVEAFSLAAEDLKFVASQFRRLHSRELRHKFRFYSHQWRTWAACFIQSAWRRYKKLKEEAKLRESEEGVNQKLRPTRSFWDVYATELIQSTRRDEKKQAGSTSDAVNTIQKPVDLDFAEEH